ncbi:hypothetical protein ACWCOW_38060 [Streptomyces sp. NPDC001939]
MAVAPTVVHPPLGTGGRRVTARGQILGHAYSDVDLIQLLRRAGLPDTEELLDHPAKRPAGPPTRSQRAGPRTAIAGSGHQTLR